MKVLANELKKDTEMIVYLSSYFMKNEVENRSEHRKRFNFNEEKILNKFYRLYNRNISKD